MFSVARLRLSLTFTSFAALLTVLGCSPSSPSCDPRGSSAADQLWVTCTSVGSDLQCTAVANNNNDLYICTAVNQTVTDQASWSSSDSSVGAFGVTRLTAGYLKAMKAGWVVISAKYGFLGSNTVAFAVAPGSSPERLVDLSLIFQDAATSKRLVGVKVEVASAHFATQSCVSSGTGGYCELWVLRGDLRVTATMTGYQDAVLTVSTDDPPSFMSQFTVTMTALPR